MRTKSEQPSASVANPKYRKGAQARNVRKARDAARASVGRGKATAPGQVKKALGLKSARSLTPAGAKSVSSSTRTPPRANPGVSSSRRTPPATAAAAPKLPVLRQNPGSRGVRAHGPQGAPGQARKRAGGAPRVAKPAAGGLNPGKFVSEVAGNFGKGVSEVARQIPGVKLPTGGVRAALNPKLSPVNKGRR